MPGVRAIHGEDRGVNGEVPIYEGDEAYLKVGEKHPEFREFRTPSPSGDRYYTWGSFEGYKSTGRRDERHTEARSHLSRVRAFPGKGRGSEVLW